MTLVPLANVTCVAIGGRGLLISGVPGSGKSSLALALIDRGAVLVGDDGVMVEPRAERLWAHPAPAIAGKLEIRSVGIVTLPAIAAPLCLWLDLGADPDRLPTAAAGEIAGASLPRLAMAACDPMGALRAEWAMRLHALPAPPPMV